MILGLVIACGRAESTPSEEWELLTVDLAETTPRGSGFNLSGEDIALTIDASGLPHVAYSYAGNSLMRHAAMGQGTITTEELDSDRGARRKAWVHGVEPLQLVYDSGYSGLVFHALQSEEGAWDVRTLETPSAAAAMALWHEGSLEFGYISEVPESPSEGTKGGTRKRHVPVYDETVPSFSAAEINTVPPVTPLLTLSAAARGGVHVVYSAPSASFDGDSDFVVPYIIRHSIFANGIWGASDIVTDRPGHYEGLSAVVDSSGNLYVALATSRLNELATVPYAGEFFRAEVWRLDSEDNLWTHEVVPSPGPVRLARGALALDSRDRLHLAYCDANEADDFDCQSLSLATRDGGNWSFQTVASGCSNVGRYSAVAVSADERVHLVSEGCDGSLVYASGGVK